MSTVTSRTGTTRLRAFLDAKGTRYTFVANLLGISPSYLTYLMNGRDPLPRKHAVRLGEHYGCAPEEFIGWVEIEEVSA
jgi:plasmid maintenance system antidote protein VapI